ncbi:MAG: glycosyltransferase [Candidatus Moranbacteria bacterium]|nr:glycosyltransferase [Candidatus Moranbacteria bacterium]
MKLLINIPAYNEEKVLAKTLKTLPKKIKGFDKVKIQIIDDGSKDKTKTIAQKAGADYVYSHRINRGLGSAFRTAVFKALENGFGVMVNIDADGQFNSADINKLVEPILKNQADIVIGSRFSGIKPKNMPWIKSFLNRMGARMVGWFLRVKTDDLTCGFRAYNKEAMLKLNLNNQFTYTQETIIDAINKNLNVIWKPVRVTYFKDRKAKMTKSISNFIYQSMMIIFRTIRDTKPLKFFGIPAFSILCASLVIFLFVLISYIYGYLETGVFKVTPYRNWLFLASILLILGIQSLVFAFLADMIKSNRKIAEDEMYESRKKNFSRSKQTDK